MELEFDLITLRKQQGLRINWKRSPYLSNLSFKRKIKKVELDHVSENDLYIIMFEY